MSGFMEADVTRHRYVLMSGGVEAEVLRHRHILMAGSIGRTRRLLP
jgi:hypothetical protein